MVAVHEWMSPDPVTVAPDTDVREARRLLQRYGVRHLPVVRGGRLVGIVSDRDVRLEQAALEALDDRRLVALVRGERDVSEVMTAAVHTISPDGSVTEAARTMLSRRISALPVVDDGGRLLGVITSTDCLLALLDVAPVS
jgi:acetoin utilization protein AcuB